MDSNNIPGLFIGSAEKYKDNIAFNYFDKAWKAVTYGELLSHTKGIASFLIKSGINNSDRIAIVSENRHEWCASYLGISMAGGIAVPIDAQLGSDEIRNLLIDSEAKVIFHSSKAEANIQMATGNIDVRKINLDSAEFKGICVTPGIDDYPIIESDDVASLLYTSGTTGKPKGVMLTHKNFCSDAEAIINAGIVTHWDNVLSILPLHHTYPFMCTFLVPVFLGATITYPQSLKGPELTAAIKEKVVTILVGVPQLLELIRSGMIYKIKQIPVPISNALLGILKICGKLRRSTGINLGKLIFKSAHKAFGARFRFFASGGAKLDPEVMEDLEAIGFTVLEGYGLTETSPVVTFNPVKKRKPNSAGKPLPSVEIKIIQTVRREALGVREEGEIAIKGPMVMKGYYRNPEATAQVMRDGWFLSGDLGYMDDEGYLFITGRSKEVIVLSSGKNLYPEEVEKQYLRIPLIKEICVLESLHVVIVPDIDYARKHRIGNIQEALRWEINQISNRLPAYMRIKGYTLYPEPLPRTPLGKLRRFMIKDLIKDKSEKIKVRSEDRMLMEDEIGRKVVGCITPLFKEKITVQSSDNLELDLGLDSLQRIELVVALEKAFSMKLPETFASDLQTVEELVTKIKEYGAKGPAEIEKRPEWKDILAAEPSDKEKKKVGFHQGFIEWLFVIILLKILSVIFELFFRLEVKGIENLPSRPFIIAPNHSSNMDGFVVGAGVPSKIFKDLYFQGFQKYFSGRLTSLFARIAHVIPIDPETYLSKALQLSSYILRNNRALCIFPEGGRSFDGNLMEFKKGIGILAVELNAPVVPTLIEGTFEALPRGARFPKLTKIKLTFGKSFRPTELDLSQKPEGMEEYQFFANELRKRVKMLKEITAAIIFKSGED